MREANDLNFSASHVSRTLHTQTASAVYQTEGGVTGH